MLQDEIARQRQQLWDCAIQCMSAQRMCLSTVRYCLDTSGEPCGVQHIRLLLDTAALCQSTAENARRGGWLYVHTAVACAEMCERSANDCDRYPNDEKLQQCAKVLRECADCCKNVQENPTAAGFRQSSSNVAAEQRATENTAEGSYSSASTSSGD